MILLTHTNRNLKDRSTLTHIYLHWEQLLLLKTEEESAVDVTVGVVFDLVVFFELVVALVVVLALLK